MSKMKALVCRECGKEYPPKAIHVCEMCFGPLEVKYNYDEIKSTISRKKIEPVSYTHLTLPTSDLV